jgi:hypothetical protein
VSFRRCGKRTAWLGRPRIELGRGDQYAFCAVPNEMRDRRRAALHGFFAVDQGMIPSEMMRTSRVVSGLVDRCAPTDRLLRLRFMEFQLSVPGRALF